MYWLGGNYNKSVQAADYLVGLMVTMYKYNFFRKVLLISCYFV